MRHIAPPLTRERALQSFERAMQAYGTRTQRLFWAVETRPHGEFLGVGGAQNFEAAAARIEVGLVLAANARGRGLACEAFSAMCSRLLSNPRIDEVTAKVAPANVVAYRALSNVGFCERHDDSALAGWRWLSLYRGSKGKFDHSA